MKEDDFMCSMGCVMAIDRTKKKTPIAVIKVDTPYYTGVTQSICLQDPLFYLVIGSIPWARNLDDPVLVWKHVPLRSQDLKLRRMPQSNL